ncbi:hypothetical protein KJ673_01160 [Patescibacteria group bacterium]|nr:hypothetical protein [Patescibacteria group bacterium]MCG2687365.1 hypothetical protein [Candidatus Parcubacteria bacterium]
MLIVFYIDTDKNEWVENEEGQKAQEKWHALLVKHPKWLNIGIIFIAIGFHLSIIAEFTVFCML